MSKKMQTFFSGTSIALGATIALSSAAIAEDNTVVLDQINQYSDNNSFAQVNSVFQLRDVAPSDWAFDALRNLVEKYNCIVGYPDGTFRGDRPLSRYEFAAGLNACMQAIERIALGGGETDPADITRLRRLVEEFEVELATLGARVDDIDGRVEFLEDNQFSTTTKLNGEVLFTLANAFGDEKAGGGDLDSEVTFNNRVRLNFDTSFREDGKDRLRTRLQAGNFGGSGTLRDDITGTDSTRLGHDAGGENSVEIDDLYYRFPVGKKLRAYVSARSLGLHNVFEANNPYFLSSGSGALSRFIRRDPATLRGPAGVGVGFNYEVTDKVKFSGLYLGDDDTASNPSSDNGFFNGDYSAGAQLALYPSERFSLAFTYVNQYQGDSSNLSDSTVDGVSTNPFGGSPTNSDNFSISSSFDVTDSFNLSGWFGYTSANNQLANENADIINWNINAALLDFGGNGNVLGLTFGQPPRVTSNDNALGTSPDVSYLAELQYRYKVNKNITITPGAYVVFNPNHDDSNDTIVVGAVRTTFKF